MKGVLPYEIDPDWPAEAQKAQAVCARSFALGTHKHGSDYDLCNTTNCQVYLGANRATEVSDAAVNATKGETLSYNGSSVIGYFYSVGRRRNRGRSERLGRRLRVSQGQG